MTQEIALVRKVSLAPVCAALVLSSAPGAFAQGETPADEPPKEEAPAEPAEAEAESAEAPVAIDPAIFDGALGDFYQEQYASAAAGFWGYIHYGDPAAEKYEWAQFFLGESLRALGFWHAAVQYYSIVAKTRSRPEILPDALARLEAISRTRPLSETLVYDDVIYDSDFGALPSGLADWINYTQGRLDYQHSFVRWGNRHFESIPRTSSYAAKADYIIAVFALKQKQDDKSIAIFQSIIDSKTADKDTKNKAYLGLARLLYDLGQYKDAEEAYGKVEQIELSFEQAELLLEKAWTAYQLKKYPEAMGYLHALDAPSYERYFLPDAYVLRGIILKELCHFIAAKRTVRAFRSKYGRALSEMHDRVPLHTIRRIFDGSTQEGPVARRTAFIKTLEAERKKIELYDSAWEDVELDKHLRRLYDLEIKEQSRRWRLEFEDASGVTARALLEAEEQVNLLDYEVGLDIFKRLKSGAARQAKEEPLVVPYDSANVYYEFDTEYWNDELHSYQYFVNSRCFEMTEAAP